MANGKVYEDFDQGLEAVLELALASDRPVVILDAGGSCAGKGLYMAEFLRRVGKHKSKSAFALKMDDCFLDFDDPKLPCVDGAPVFDMPGSYHLEEFRGYVSELLQGKWIHYPEYDLDNNKRLTATQLIMPTDILLIDGLFAISTFADFDWRGAQVIRVYIEAKPQVRLGRLLGRDSKYADEDRITSVFLWRVLPMHYEYVEPQKELAEIVIVNNMKREVRE